MSFSGNLGNLSNVNNSNINPDLAISDDWEEVDISETPKELSTKNQNLGFEQSLKAPIDLFKSSGSTSINDASNAIDNLPGNPAPITPGVSNLKPIVVSHPRTGIAMEVPRKMLVGLTASTNLQDLTKIMQTKLNNGHDILSRCQEGKTVLPTKSDVSDVMWYVQVAAEHKAGGPFTQGAVSIEDKSGRIRNFFDNAKDLSYQRPSTHVKGFQSMPGGYPRGINLYGKKDDLSDSLPYGKQTMLYQQMGMQGTKKTPGMHKTMLLLKMEEHGCFSQSQQVVGRGPTRNENPQDSQAFWGHVKTTIQSFIRRLTGNNTPAGSRKERLSTGLTKAYDKMSSWKLVGGQPSAVRTILQRGNPTSSSSGIRVMTKNINDAKDLLRTGGADPKYARKLDEFVAKHLSDPQWDNKKVRIGNEVILSAKDLDIPDRAEHAVGKTAQQIVQPYNKQDFMESVEYGLIAAYEDKGSDYMPDPKGDPLVCKQFALDVLTRSSYHININGENVDTSNGNDAKLDSLKDFFTDNNSKLDRKSLLLASQLINQSTLGLLMDEERGESGPTPGNVFGQPSSSTNVQVDLFRDEIGNTRIRMTHKMPVQSINSNVISHETDNDKLPQANRQIEFSFPRNPEPEDLRVRDYNYKFDSKD